MKKSFMTLGLLAGMIALVVACGQRTKANAETNAEATAQTDQEALDMAPDFELPDLQGNPLLLSSLRGKYVIIDFWGSWCPWCIKGFPGLKASYAKYKDKLEILGVDCRDTEEKWKAAVAEYELPWMQVYCSDGNLQELAQMYQLEAFPTKVVVDPEGKLVKTVVGEDPAFYSFLDELLGK